MKKIVYFFIIFAIVSLTATEIGAAAPSKQTSRIWVGMNLPANVKIGNVQSFVKNKIDGLLKPKGSFVVETPHITIIPPMDLTQTEYNNLVQVISAAANDYKTYGFKGLSGLYFDKNTKILGKGNNIVAFTINTSQSQWNNLMTHIGNKLKKANLSYKTTTFPHVSLGSIKPANLAEQNNVKPFLSTVNPPHGATSAQDSFCINKITLYQTTGKNTYVELISISF